jgi:hypothetical protein
MQQDNIFGKLRVGVNALALLKLARAPDLSPNRQLAHHDAGVQHWAILAARNGGVLDLRTQTSEKDGRTYTSAPFPLQSLPKHPGVRAAITSPYPGEVLINADWRASHWQLLAFWGDDTQLQNDCRSGDMYTTLFPARDRKQVKAGLATVLNGGGVHALTKTFGSEEKAKEFQAEVKHLLRTRWAKANAYRLQLRDKALANGWADADKPYAGAGVALMRDEARALRAACEDVLAQGLGARVVLPLHDGVLLSAKPERAQAVAEALAKAMVLYTTLSEKEAVEHTNTWVEVEVTRSWGGDEPQLLGHDLRVAALSGLEASGEDTDGLTLAAACIPDAVEARARALPPGSTAGRRLRAALSRRKDAISWLNGVIGGEGPARVELPQMRCTYANLCRILREDTALPRLRYNVRTLSAEVDGVKIDDNEMGPRFAAPIEIRYEFPVDFNLLARAITDVAREDCYDPILDYFESLKWDGVPRLSTWLYDYTGGLAGAASDPVKMANVYGQKWCLSVVARAYRPGCKVDSLLVLQGTQNIGKSKLFLEIAPKGSYTEVAVDPSDKDLIKRASAFAIVEWPEAAGMGRREQESLKQYFSTQIDRIRLPYGRTDIEIPRRVVFGMTANGNDFLKDPTGSRRYWPVTTTAVDIGRLKSVIEQVWAEAVYVYKEDPVKQFLWWLTPEEDKMREEAAIEYTQEDPYVEAVLAVAARNNGHFTTREVMCFLDIKAERQLAMARPISQSIRAQGYKSITKRVDGVVTRVWVPSDHKE